MLHELMTYWFNFVRDGGYLGVTILMAMESSVFPVPSELVVPPAAFWAAQGKMSFAGVIAAGTIGSYIGSALTYLASRAVGLPFLLRYGKYFLMTPEKIAMAEEWVKEYSVFGIFMARLLPVVRHLISIPAGILRMKFLPFSIVTIIGSLIWCTVLAYFGRDVIGSRPDLLDSPATMVSVLKEKLHHVVLGIVLLGGAYLLMLKMRKRAVNKERLPA